MAELGNELDKVFPTHDEIYGGNSNGTNAFLASLRPLRAWELDDTLASTDGRPLSEELEESAIHVPVCYFEALGNKSDAEFGELKPALDMAFAPMEEVFDARMLNSSTPVEIAATQDEMRLYYSNLFDGMESYSRGARGSIEDRRRAYVALSESDDPIPSFDVDKAKLGLARVNSACCESIRESADRMNEKYHFLELDDLYEFENVDVYGVDSSKLGLAYRQGMDLLDRPKTDADFTKIDDEYLNGIASVSKQGVDVNRYVFLGHYAELNQISEPEDDFTKHIREKLNPHIKMEREFEERIALHYDDPSAKEEIRQDMRKYYNAVFEGLEAHSAAGKELINSTYLDASGNVSAGDADDLTYANKGLAYANCYNATWAMESYTKMENRYHFAEIEDVIQMESRDIYGVKDLSRFVPGNSIRPIVPDYGDNSLTFQDNVWKEDESVIGLPRLDMSGARPHHMLAPSLSDAPNIGKKIGKIESDRSVNASGITSLGWSAVGSKKLGVSSSTIQKDGAEPKSEILPEKSVLREEKPLDGVLLRKRRERMAEMLLSDSLKDQLGDQPRYVAPCDDHQMN